MAKWYGKIGYAVTEEIEPGIWSPNIKELYYYGEVISNRWKRQSTDSINDNIVLSKVISIVADPFANQHCSEIIYVEYMGTKWKVTDVEPQFPRLLLTMGGRYNGE